MDFRADLLDALSRRLIRDADRPAPAGPPRILVTGSSGRLGRHLAARWPAAAWRGFDLRPGPATTRVGAVEDRAAVRAAVVGTDTVVHLAALHAPDVGTASPAAFRRVNVEGTKRLLDAASSAGLRRFVLASSTSVYGAAMVDPDRAVWIDETLPPAPRDVYDETKLAAEALVLAADGAFPEGTAVLRIARCVDEPAPLRAWHRLYRGIAAADVAAAFERAVLSDAGGIFNVAARTRLRREDAAILRTDPLMVLRARYPSLDLAPFAAFAAAGIDRVYDGAKAAVRLGFASRFDAVSGDERARQRCAAAVRDPIRSMSRPK